MGTRLYLYGEFEVRDISYIGLRLPVSLWHILCNETLSNYPEILLNTGFRSNMMVSSSFCQWQWRFAVSRLSAVQRIQISDTIWQQPFQFNSTLSMPHFLFFSLAPSLPVRLKPSRSFSNSNPGIRCVGEKSFGARRGAIIPLHPNTPIPVPALLHFFPLPTGDWLCSDVNVIRLKVLLSGAHLRGSCYIDNGILFRTVKTVKPTGKKVTNEKTNYKVLAGVVLCPAAAAPTPSIGFTCPTCPAFFASTHSLRPSQWPS